MIYKLFKTIISKIKSQSHFLDYFTFSVCLKGKPYIVHCNCLIQLLVFFSSIGSLRLFFPYQFLLKKISYLLYKVCQGLGFSDCILVSLFAMFHYLLYFLFIGSWTQDLSQIQWFLLVWIRLLHRQKGRVNIPFKFPFIVKYIIPAAVYKNSCIV